MACSDCVLHCCIAVIQAVVVEWVHHVRHRLHLLNYGYRSISRSVAWVNQQQQQLHLPPLATSTLDREQSINTLSLVEQWLSALNLSINNGLSVSPLHVKGWRGGGGEARRSQHLRITTSTYGVHCTDQTLYQPLLVKEKGLCRGRCTDRGLC
jgi:hypothetical protein